MKPTIAVIAMGEMGAGIGRTLVENGACVLTSLAGRSAASAARAAQAGVEIVTEDSALAAGVDFVFSIVPPACARELSARLLPVLLAATRKPVFVDCNAIAPETVREIAAGFQSAALPFLDVGIVGAAPAAGRPGPRLYASGPEVAQLERLRGFGLDVRPLSGQVGDASALKMAYGGINKGLQALGSALMLNAGRAGVAPALIQEMRESQPDVLNLLVRSLPGMYAKAYRWVGEMEEIAKSLTPEEGPAEMFLGAARWYESIARDHAAGAGLGKIASINEFLSQAGEKQA